MNKEQIESIKRDLKLLKDARKIELSSGIVVDEFVLFLPHEYFTEEYLTELSNEDPHLFGGVSWQVRFITTTYIIVFNFTD